MFKKGLLIFFIMSFALQTTAAMIDEYQPHANNENSLSFDHGHDSVDYKLDTHHCCHCHANTQIYSNDAIHFSFEKYTSGLFEYQIIYPSISLSLKLRPPKA